MNSWNLPKPLEQSKGFQTILLHMFVVTFFKAILTLNCPSRFPHSNGGLVMWIGLRPASMLVISTANGTGWNCEGGRCGTTRSLSRQSNRQLEIIATSLLQTKSEVSKYWSCTDIGNIGTAVKIFIRSTCAVGRYCSISKTHSEDIHTFGSKLSVQ